MKPIETTNQLAHGHMRTIFRSADARREIRLAQKFRVHLVGIYHSQVGVEWDSDGKRESDYLHHIEIVFSGRRQVVMRDKCYDLEPGQLWFLPGNNPVERRCRENCEVLFFKLQCEWLPGVDPLLDWPGREPRLIGRFDPAEWEIWRSPAKTPDLGDLLRLRGLLLIWMASAVPELEVVLGRHVNSHTHFTAVFEMIEKHLGADLRLPELAAVYGTSPEAFAVAFRRGTGISPKEYLTRRINQEAIQFVINTDMKMGEIADKLRFRDEYYFSRFFQKMNGSPPSRYRKNFRNPMST